MTASRKFPTAAAFGLTAPGLAATARNLVQSGTFPWHPELAVEGKAMATALAAANPARLTEALIGAAREHGEQVKAGIDRYLQSDSGVPVLNGAEVWNAVTTRLMAYGEGGVPVLMIPSLINRATILDITPDRSMAAWLARAGARPFILDWQEPGDEESGFSIADYIRERVAPAIDWIHSETGKQPIVLGHCTGGLIALAAACHAPAKISGLALISAPWDFHAGGPVWLTRAASSFAKGLPEKYTQTAKPGILPPALFDMFFASLDPVRPAAKFRDFAKAELAPADQAAFVGIEDWANDGVPVSMPLAMEIFANWYGANQTSSGTWEPATGEAVAALGMPVLIAYGTSDRIVPACSAQSITAMFSNASVIEAETGHVGLVAGRRAEKLLWQPLLRWIKA